eukprot:328792-Prorocentrum_minimum.AAC.2
MGPPAPCFTATRTRTHHTRGSLSSHAASRPLRLVPTPGICSLVPSAIGSNTWNMLSSPLRVVPSFIRTSVVHLQDQVAEGMLLSLAAMTRGSYREYLGSWNGHYRLHDLTSEPSPRSVLDGKRRSMEGVSRRSGGGQVRVRRGSGGSQEG